MINSFYLKPRSPGFKLHSYYSELLSTPIPGWRVLIPRPSNGSRGPGLLRQLHVAVQRSPIFWGLSNLVVPTLETLAFPYASRASKLERDADITYCANHVQTRSRSWVADCEHVAALTGYYDPGVESRWLGQRLQDPSCKGFYCWSSKALENSKAVLGRGFPEGKSHVVYPATAGTPDSGERDDFDGSFRICHMTTHRSSYLENISNFYVKGTRDVLLLLKHMSHDSRRLLRKMTVTLRAWCPESYVDKLRAQGIKIEVIQRPLARAEALSYLMNSDLALMPCHSTPTMIFIEAMSKSLPVIANDVWANSEYVLDGETGFLVEPPRHVRYADKYQTPLWYRPGFVESLKAPPETGYLKKYLQILSYLVEDENHLLSLKKKTGGNFKKSPFDASRRNERLGLLLKGALA